MGEKEKNDVKDVGMIVFPCAYKMQVNISA